MFDSGAIISKVVQKNRVSMSKLRARWAGRKIRHDGLEQNSAQGTGDKDTPDLWLQAFKLTKKRNKNVARHYLKYLMTLGEHDSRIKRTQHVARSIARQLRLQKASEDWQKSFSPAKAFQVAELSALLKVSREIVAKEGDTGDTDNADKTDKTKPYAIIACSSLCIFLQLVGRLAETERDTIVHPFASIARRQLAWKSWEDKQNLNRIHPRALETLVDLYSYILEHQANIICLLSTLQSSGGSWMELSQEQWTYLSNGASRSELSQKGLNAKIKEAFEAKVSKVDELSQRCARYMDGQQEVAGEPSVSGRASSPDDDSMRLWNKAYNLIKKADLDLVMSFERILSEKASAGHSKDEKEFTVTAQGGTVSDLPVESEPIGEKDLNVFAQGITASRFEFMKQAVQNSLQKAESQGAIQNGVLTIANFVLNLQGVGNSLLSAQPAAAMAWSGICAVIQILSEKSNQDQAMIEGLRHVADNMPWYLGLSSCVVNNEWKGSTSLMNLKKTIQEKILYVYQAMLKYQMESVAYCYHERPLARDVKTIFGFNDWRSRIKAMKALEHELKTYLSQYSSQERNDMLGHIASELPQHFGLIGQFKTTCYEDYINRVPRQVPGTCEQIQNDEKYTNWTKQKDEVLVISAGLGCGKSVLARFLVQDLLPQSDPPTIVTHFFFKHDSKQSSIPHALCALIHQILYQQSNLVSCWSEEIQAHGPALLTDLASLWMIFKQVVGPPNKKQIICVLDGLDACRKAERTSFMKRLKELQHHEKPQCLNVKFLITTRDVPDILEGFQGLRSASVLNMGQDCTARHKIQRWEIQKWKVERLMDLQRGMDPTNAAELHDDLDANWKALVALQAELPTKEEMKRFHLWGEIDLVVSYRLDQLASKKGLSRSTHALISNELREPSSEPRSYLWACGVLDTLEQNLDDTPGAWESIVRHPPRKLFDTFEGMLQSTAGQEVQRVRDLFHLILAASQPLTVHELNIAMHVRHSSQVAYSERDLPLPSDQSFQTWIAATCGLFVTVFEGRVFFAHRTAEAFLLREGGGEMASPETTPKWEGSVTIAQAHRFMAESCISFLSLGVFTTPQFTRMTAAFNAQLREAQRKIDIGTLHPNELLDEAYRACGEFMADFELSSFALYALRHWMGHFDLAQEFNDNGLVRDIHTSFHAAYFGLFSDTLPIAKPWLVVAAQILEEDCGYRLTEFDGATGNVRCHSSITVASIAAAFGHYRLLEQSLKEEAPEFEEPSLIDLDSPVIDPPSPSYQPIFFAAALGHPKCLDYILEQEHARQSDAKDCLQRTPLHQAARLGRYECLEALAQHFGLDEKDYRSWTPFDYLVHFIHGTEDMENARDVLRLLSQDRASKQADPEDIRDSGASRVSLLSLVSMFPNETFLENHHCLESVEGAQRAKDIISSRLFQTAYQGSLIKLLVDQGDDVNQPEHDGRIPLHFASMGHFWNTAFLLHAGAAVFASDSHERRPLHYASTVSSAACITIASVLLDYGASPNECDCDGMTPFALATLRCDSYGDDLMTLLLGYGADPHHPRLGRKSPLGMAEWSTDRLDVWDAWILDTSMLWSSHLGAV